MRNRHPRTALTFIVLGVLLLASVAIGQLLGDRALFGSTEQRSPVVAPLTTPVPEDSSNPSVSRNWKRLQIVSVATDPAFPDPRVTRPPTPTPKPSPTPSPQPSPSPPRRDELATPPPLPGPTQSPGLAEPSAAPRQTLPPVRYEQ